MKNTTERKLRQTNQFQLHIWRIVRPFDVCVCFFSLWVFFLYLDRTSQFRCVFVRRTTCILAAMKVQRCQQMCQHNNLLTLSCLNLINNTILFKRYHLQNVYIYIFIKLHIFSLFFFHHCHGALSRYIHCRSAKRLYTNKVFFFFSILTISECWKNKIGNFYLLLADGAEILDFRFYEE